MAPAGSNFPITDLLRRWRTGDRQALDQIMPLIQNELHARAQRLLRGDRRAQTFQPTALVNEAYVRLAGQAVNIDWSDRAHFLAVAARVMRQILVDHARAQLRHKRGGQAVRVTLQEDQSVTPGPDLDVLALNAAISRLAERSERKAQLVEMHFFGGLTYSELAMATEVSEATVHRELRLAKAWLRRDLTPPIALTP